jgi:hypothetical protein
MKDPLPLWAGILRFLGWCVSQEFQVVCFDSQKTVVIWISGMPRRKDAEDRCDASKGQWVRRVIEVWADAK